MKSSTTLKDTPTVKTTDISYLPMLATLGKKISEGEEWIFEKKIDGYRCLVYINKTVKLLSRNGLNFGTKYPTIIKALSAITCEAVIDGELVVEDKDGRSLFNEMQNYSGDKGEIKLRFYVFDLLAMNQHDIRHLELTKRKELLKVLIANLADPSIIYNEHVTEGQKLFNEAEKRGWEGILAKKVNSSYLSGKRADSWIKYKTQNSQEAVIIGFSKPSGSRHYFGSLVLAMNEGNSLVYIGSVGTGFTEKTLKELYETMAKLVTDKKPVSGKVKDEKFVTWIKPKLVCEVTFSEWTKDRSLRHPVYKGLRVDKAKKEVVKE